MSPLLRVNVLSHCRTELLTHLYQCIYSCSAYFCEFWSEFNFDSTQLVLNHTTVKISPFQFRIQAITVLQLGRKLSNFLCHKMAYI